jgi:uncharacterized alpha-E superfamily protein
MLSRLAESLYWIGRYVERAEDTARLLDVHLTLLLDDPWAAEDVVCASLLAAMGQPAQGPSTRTRVLEQLAWRPDATTSVVGALSAARENARRSREVVSAEMWESINVTWHEVTRASRRRHHHTVLAWVRERAAAFNGTADGTMSRDEAWHFLLLGRYLERADMTARLVAARTLAGSSGPSWTTLLQSCGAWQAFLRGARGAVDDDRAARFLLLDPVFPRSLMSALVSAEDCLLALARSHGATTTRGPSDEAHRALGQIRSQLEFMPADDLVADTYPVMQQVLDACAATGAAVTTRYFQRSPVTSWQAS